MPDAIVHGLDVTRLDRYLRDCFPELGGTIRVEPAVGGMSNPTYFISYGEWSVVLRKQPGATLSKSAHSIDREFRVMSAMHESEVPVPKPIRYCHESDIVGTPFYLMERLRGRVFSEYASPGLTPAERRACFESMAATMAAIHRFDWARHGLADYGRPGNYFERQLSRWSEQWERIRQADNPYIDQLIGWMRDRIPVSTAISVCHGDFRMPNLMFHATEARVIGVIDWELSTLGHPLADVAFNVQAWRMTPDENGGIRGLDHAALGIPSEREYLESYYARAGSSERMTSFHLAFAMFRAAVGTAGVAARAEAAGGTQSEGVALGRRLSLAYARAGVEAIASGA